MEDKMTIDEALKNGYTSYCYAEDGFQSLGDLSDPESINWSRKPELMEKEPYHPAGIGEEDLREMLADHIHDQHTSECDDDTDSVFDAVKSIDLKIFEPLVSAICEKLSTLKYYRSSGIELVKTATP